MFPTTGTVPAVLDFYPILFFLFFDEDIAIFSGYDLIYTWKEWKKIFLPDSERKKCSPCQQITVTLKLVGKKILYIYIVWKRIWRTRNKNFRGYLMIFNNKLDFFFFNTNNSLCSPGGK